MDESDKPQKQATAKAAWATWKEVFLKFGHIYYPWSRDLLLYDSLVSRSKAVRLPKANDSYKPLHAELYTY